MKKVHINVKLLVACSGIIIIVLTVGLWSIKEYRQVRFRILFIFFFIFCFFYFFIFFFFFSIFLLKRG